MTSKDLQADYRADLARMLAPEAGRHVNPKTTAWMLKHAAATEGGTYTPETGARTWIWSDLHLHHKNIIRYCSRPFQSVEAMNEALLAAWKETVGEADTIICGGDIALAGALKRERLARVRAMPERKLLVRGNHDFGKERAPRRYGQRRNVDDPGHHRQSDARGNANRYERGARRNGEPVRARAQQRAVAGRTVREHLRRAHRVPAAPARRRATAGLGTAR